MAVIRYSKKLFYGEWAYKIRLKMPTGYNQYIKTLLRYTRDSTVEAKLSQLTKRIAESEPYGPFVEYSPIKLERMCEFIRYARKNNMEKDCRFNEYWQLITVYTNNAKYIDDIQEQFSEVIDYIETPANDEELKIMQTKLNTTIVDRLPYNKYRYMCKLDFYNSRHHTESTCEQFTKWAKPFGKRIKMSTRWNFGKRWSVFNKFWVQDQKLLHMVQLYLGNKILKTETYKLRSEL